jgi:hypothetical protein
MISQDLLNLERQEEIVEVQEFDLLTAKLVLVNVLENIIVNGIFVRENN